ncbi:hypothetical protein BC834DRAFT_237693 [Gloeopeniophorella convolvens]|nr:hypothetical protein BC834DRAFT_237693 [Gloeopeniophorella convolvens]
MSDQIDVESALPSLPHGPLRSDTDDSKASTGPTFVTSPRPGATLDTRFDEKSPLDGGHGHARSTTMDSFPGMLERRNTGINQMAYGDPAAKIWGLYLSRAEKVDRDQSERWRGNTDGILVFTGLFSAVVASFILVSYQDLQPDSSETTNLLLSRISQQLSALSTDNGTAPPSLTVDKIESTFSPSASAIRVNIMWFLSLSFSLYCALQATLMQQWTRKYLQSIDRPYAPARRARIRAFFAEGVQKWRLITAVEALPVFLHISVLLFFVGLVDWLLQINHVLGWLQLGLSILGVLGYFEITFLPLLFPDTPYHTQLTSMFWGVRESLPLIFLWLRRKDEAVLSSIKARRQKLKDGMRRTFEETAFGRSWRMDARAIKWTLASLDEDTELEEFLDGLPGLFRASKPEDVRAFKDHLEPTIAPVTDRLLATCSINLLPDRVLRRRLTACLGAIWSFSSSTERHFRAIWDQWDGATADDKWGPLSTETWSVAQSRTADIDPRVAFRAHCVQALAAVMWRNGRWQGPEPRRPPCFSVSWAPPPRSCPITYRRKATSRWRWRQPANPRTPLAEPARRFEWGSQARSEGHFERNLQGRRCLGRVGRAEGPLRPQ